jgi:alpha-ketoglutarate-dependent taurine dioxygenase
MKKLPTLHRRPVQLAAGERVTLDALTPNGRLPLAVRPARPDLEVSLEEWAAESRTVVEDRLAEHGGLLFRGFDVASLDAFERFIGAVSGGLLEYRNQATPRSQVSGRLYSSTDYPADQTIELHNESSYAASFPLRIFFHCVVAAEEGGETPLADSREVWRRLDPAVRRRFAERGVMYVRNFVDGLGLDWRKVFDTASREEVAERCRSAGIEAEWRADGGLTTREVRPAVACHPRTGETVWFNQAAAFHLSTVEPEQRRLLIAQFGRDGVPKTTCYGDGGAIEDESLAAIRQAYAGATVTFPWQRGDVLMLDNMLVAHGRRPYRGPRKIVVGMSEAIDGERVCMRGEPA